MRVGDWFHNQPYHFKPRLRVGGWFWNQPLIKGWFHGQKVGGWGLVVAPTLNQRLVGWGLVLEPTLATPGTNPSKSKKAPPLPEALQCSGAPPGAKNH